MPKLDRYEILAKIGKGGMGVVYKARDTKLDRVVALKFLSSYGRSDEEAKQRLIREAKAASALDHMNICTVHDIGETDEGDLFIAMAYYRGETLGARLAGGALPVNRAVEYARQIADGLRSAHESSIVHRDIKPANIFISADNRVKILDFGLAKTGEVGLTKTGSTLGTVAYMSPEQVRGEPVDHRTDIWSLGVVLYEMLTCCRPFPGAYEQAVMYAILHSEPEPIRDSKIPESLRLSVIRALSKNRDNRPADMAEFQRLLASPESSAPGMSTEDRKAIVVMPFRDISTAEDNAYLSDGFTEEVITDLSGLQSLRVISRSSSMRLKDSKMSIPEIASRLSVRYVLDGSVRKAGSRFRINAQLIDAETDAILWASRFDGSVEDVFDIQEEVARAVVDALRLQLSPRDERSLAERQKFDARTNEAYLRARYEMWRFSEASLTSALRHVTNAIEQFGSDERLLSLLGQIHATFLQTGAGNRAEHLQEAETLIKRLFEMGPESEHAYRLRAVVRFHAGDIRAALPDARRAHELDPNDADTLALLSYMYLLTGDEDRALGHIEHLLSIDPLTPINLCVRGMAEVVFGRPERGTRYYRTAYEMEPDTSFMALFYEWALIWSGQLSEARPVLEHLKETVPNSVTALVGAAYFAAARGDRELVRESITEEVESAARNVEVFSRFLAEIFAMAGDEDTSLGWLENSVRIGLINYPYLRYHNPMLDNLRGVPRFETLLERVKEEWRDNVATSRTAS